MKRISRSALFPSLSVLLCLCVIGVPMDVAAETSQATPDADRLSFVINNTWMLVAAILVFIMHLDFALLESGLTRAKNTVNILFKNVAIVGIGVLTYAAVGFNLMYPGEAFAGAALGVFLLWFGWFGFNGGSVLSADPASVSHVFVTTTLAASAGLVGSMLTSWSIQAKPDLSMVLNGVLAGLVGVTAGADILSPLDAVFVGGVSGVLVVVSVIGLDRIRVDDPVGAISVHLVCGIWGTLAVGIFGTEQALLPQIVGVVATGAFSFSFAFGLFWMLERLVGLRVGSDEELRGLDIEEHGQEAYAGFQIFTTQ